MKSIDRQNPTYIRPGEADKAVADPVAVALGVEEAVADPVAVAVGVEEAVADPVAVAAVEAVGEVAKWWNSLR